jgi:isopentenyl-diphosphate Delta-isomerase
MEHVILVDEKDTELGTMEKLEAHQKGVLHRAFSILLFNSKGELLLQKRAITKYHSGGLWTNTCCSHPRPTEKLSEAVNRKLKQEMGIDLQPKFAFSFIYQAALDKNLVEHELDHVFIGQYDGEPILNTEEAEGWKYQSLEQLREAIAQRPDDYTEWFKIIINHPYMKQISV